MTIGILILLDLKLCLVRVNIKTEGLYPRFFFLLGSCEYNCGMSGCFIVQCGTRVTCKGYCVDYCKNSAGCSAFCSGYTCADCCELGMCWWSCLGGCSGERKK